MYDIHEVNLAYLFLLRRLIHEGNKNSLGSGELCPQVISVLSALSTDSLLRLAHSSSVLCRLEMSVDVLKKLLSVASAHAGELHA